MLLSLLLSNLLKLIVCLYVSDWYLLGVKLGLSHTQIRPLHMDSLPGELPEFSALKSLYTEVIVSEVIA